MGVLEGLGRFIVGFDVKDRFCFQSHTVVNHSVKKSDSVPEISAVNFAVG